MITLMIDPKITIDGVRVSKYSITAIKIGKNVSAQMRAEFEQFS
jgi:hypothetical protein